MHAWFSLHPLDPAVVEVKALHHFEWFSKGKISVIEAMEKDRAVRSQFRGGSSSIVSSATERPRVVASKLQALSPKYNSIMNHIRINLPEVRSYIINYTHVDRYIYCVWFDSIKWSIMYICSYFQAWRK